MTKMKKLCALVTVLACMLALPTAADAFSLEWSDVNGEDITFHTELPAQFQEDGVIAISAANHDAKDDGTNHVESDGLIHYYLDVGQITSASACTLTYTVDIPAGEAGTYDLCLDLRMKDSKVRYTDLVVNGEESTRVTMGYEIDDEILAQIKNDVNSTYLTGYSVVLQEGKNTITLTVPSDFANKTMHFRNLYLVNVTPAAELVEVVDTTVVTAPATFDGVVVAVCAAVISAAGYVVSKKR